MRIAFFREHFEVPKISKSELNKFIPDFTNKYMINTTNSRFYYPEKHSFEGIKKVVLKIQRKRKRKF